MPFGGLHLDPLGKRREGREEEGRGMGRLERKGVCQCPPPN